MVEEIKVVRERCDDNVGEAEENVTVDEIVDLNSVLDDDFDETYEEDREPGEVRDEEPLPVFLVVVIEYGLDVVRRDVWILEVLDAAMHELR